MSDYTPTTEEVRDAFSDYKEDDAGGWFKAQAGFDRWLAKHDAEVAKAERERIIALLQREASEWISHDGECDCRVKGEEDLRLIELIKGENE